MYVGLGPNAAWLFGREFAIPVSRRNASIHEDVAAGDELTIFTPDGEVLWQGKLKWRRQGWFGHTTLVPKEVGKQWVDWFHMSPPLKARLTK